MSSQGGLTGFSNSAIDSHDSAGGTSQRSAAKSEYQQARPSEFEKRQDEQASDGNNGDYGPNNRSEEFRKSGHSANEAYGRENSEPNKNDIPEAGYARGSQSTTYGRDHKESNIGTEEALGSSDDTAKNLSKDMYSGAGTDDSTNGPDGPGGDVYNSTSKKGYNDTREVPGKEYEGSGDNYGSSGGY